MKSIPHNTTNHAHADTHETSHHPATTNQTFCRCHGSAQAYLHAITQGLSAQDAAAFATEASSKIVTKSGPRLSTQEAHNLKTTLPNYKNNTIMA